MPTTAATPEDLRAYFTSGEVDALLASRDKVIVDLSRRVAALEKAPAPTPELPAPSGAITRVGADWIRNGVPWRPKAVNAQTLLCGDSMIQVERLFKAFPPGSLFRTFFLANPLAPMSIEQLHQVQSAALKYQHVLLIALSNGAYQTNPERPYDPWRDGDKYDAWYEGGWRAQLLPHFDRVVRPLADAPNIIWQNINELGQAGGHRLTVDKTREFQHATCSEIKARAPNHLVFGGVQDAWPGRFIGSPAEYAAVHNSPAIDGTGMHEYESVIPYRNYGAAHRFAGLKAAMDALGKIMIVGEYGVGDGDQQSTPAAVRAERASSKEVAYRKVGAKCSAIWAVAEPWAKPEPTIGAGAWERIDSPVVAAIVSA